MVAKGYEPWAFSGSRIRVPRVAPLTEQEQLLVKLQVADLPDNALVITGGAEGVDALVNRFAAERGLKRLNILPATTNWTDWDAIEGSVIMRTRYTALKRDEKIVQAAHHLRVIGLHESWQLPRSGTFATARYGQKARILRRVLILRPVQGDAPIVLEGNDVCVCHPQQCACASPIEHWCRCKHHSH